MNDGHEEVGEVHQVVAGLTRDAAAPPAGDKGDVGSSVGSAAFAADNHSILGFSSGAELGSIVAREEDEGVVAQSQGFELVENASDELVGIFHHVLEVDLVAFQFLSIAHLVDPFGIRGRDIGSVGEDHRVVDEEGLRLFAFDVVDQKIRADVRRIIHVARFNQLPVAQDAGVPVARGHMGPIVLDGVIAFRWALGVVVVIVLCSDGML